MPAERYDLINRNGRVLPHHSAVVVVPLKYNIANRDGREVLDISVGLGRRVRVYIGALV